MYSVHNNDNENILPNFCWGLSTTGIFIDYSFAVILISRIEFQSLIHYLVYTLLRHIFTLLTIVFFKQR